MVSTSYETNIVHMPSSSLCKPSHYLCTPLPYSARPFIPYVCPLSAMRAPFLSYTPPPCHGCPFLTCVHPQLVGYSFCPPTTAPPTLIFVAYWLQARGDI